MSERLFDTVYVWSVSRVGQDSVVQEGGGWGGKGWMWYKRWGWVGFRIMIKVSY